MNRFRIISQLGAGGCGEAFRAWDFQQGVPVVLKRPLAEHLRTPSMLKRFEREIIRLSELVHPHIVPIVDHGQDKAGRPYIVMRFLPAGSLADRKKPQAASLLHTWLPGVGAALDYVHSRGVVHRDVKPANIFFDTHSTAYLGDFGIAKVIDDELAEASEHSLTRTGVPVGTEPYMAPEFFRQPRVLTGAYDQYALAITVYEMICGRRPFSGSSGELIFAHATRHPPDIRATVPDAPESLCQAVHQALAKNPDDRFESCTTFAKAALRDVAAVTLDDATRYFLCPACTTLVRVPTDAGGRRCRCTRCDAALRISENLDALWRQEEAPSFVRTKPRQASHSDKELPARTPSDSGRVTAHTSPEGKPEQRTQAEELQPSKSQSSPPTSKSLPLKRFSILTTPLEEVVPGTIWLLLGAIGPCGLLIAWLLGPRVMQGPVGYISVFWTGVAAILIAPAVLISIAILFFGFVLWGSKIALGLWRKQTTSSRRVIAAGASLSVLVAIASTIMLRRAPTGNAQPASPLPLPRLVNSIGMEFTLIPSGEFRMGSDSGEPNEKPAHDVHLTQPYYLGTYEVTNAQWKAVMGSLPSEWKDDDRPIEGVSWDDVSAFCLKLSERQEERAAGRIYRLPTEAEWEYACRAGTSTQFSCGDDASRLDAWFGANVPWSPDNLERKPRTQPVGTSSPNPWGLYDLHGNVAEWVADRYGPYSETAGADPLGPSEGSLRVFRGGNYLYAAGFCRSSYRCSVDPSFRGSTVGFRLAFTPTGPDAAEALRTSTPSPAIGSLFEGQSPEQRDRIIAADGGS